ncbi:MAG: GlsB/YeaQ/YmgE family stress response membrane protein [Clostridia bacterium]
MSWLAWIVLGGLAGWVASIITRNNSQMGIIWNIVVGIIGALAGSWILGLLGVTEPLTFSFTTFLVAVGGAVVLLFLFNLLRGKRRR